MKNKMEIDTITGIRKPDNFPIKSLMNPDNSPKLSPKQKYKLEIHPCDCHPETCTCDPYAIYENGKKYITIFEKSTGEHIVEALNFFEENKLGLEGKTEEDGMC
jgi:hypothetical protein